MSLHAVEKFSPTLDEVLALTAAGFERQPDKKMRDVAKNMWEASSDASYRVKQAGADIAQLLCRVYSVPGGDVLWINSAMIRREYRGQGIGTTMMRHALADTGAGYVGLNTQSVTMYASAQNVADLHPKLDGAPIPPDIKEIYQALCPSGKFPINHRLFDGEALYDEFPDHPLADQFYGLEGFDAHEGDALVCVGKIHSMADGQ